MSPKAMRRAGSTSPRDPGARMRIFMRLLCERSSLRISHRRAMLLLSAPSFQLAPPPRSVAQLHPSGEDEPDEERVGRAPLDDADRQIPGGRCGHEQCPDKSEHSQADRESA